MDPFEAASLGEGCHGLSPGEATDSDRKGGFTSLDHPIAACFIDKQLQLTSHRKPIARITVAKPAEPTSTNPLQKAIDAGLISWRGQKPNLPPPVKLNDGGPLMSDIVIEDRG